jgi:tetratricopeptide (TPR) repeat protein
MAHAGDATGSGNKAGASVPTTPEATEMPADEGASSTAERFVLESNRRLSESLLWQLQRNFFDLRGVQPWTEGVIPNYITSNTYIANAYAKVVFGWLRDWHGVERSSTDARPPLDYEEPIYIIELGCGLGRFAYLFLNKFLNRLRLSTLKDLRITYVMSDVGDMNLDVLCSHPSLQAFVESGHLDFARFDIERDDEFRLRHSGRVLAAGSVANPVVILANYVFDSLPNDLFSLKDRELSEGLVTISAPEREPDLSDPALLERIEIGFEYRQASADYYEDVLLNEILKGYLDRLGDTALVFPIAALRCIRRLEKLCGGRLLLLSADKGYCREEELRQLSEPSMVTHGGCFSMMVNYHAFEEYFLRRGGHAMHPPHAAASINVSAFQLGLDAGRDVETKLAFNDSVVEAGPDDFFSLYKVLQNSAEQLTLEQILSYLRLSGWDHLIVIECFPVMMEHIRTSHVGLLIELRQAVGRVWENYFPIREPHDLAFILGMLLSQMLCFSDALDFFIRSHQLYGPDKATWFNMAVCNLHLARFEDAQKCLDRVLELVPGSEEALNLREEIRQAQLGRQPV